MDVVAIQYLLQNQSGILCIRSCLSKNVGADRRGKRLHQISVLPSGSRVGALVNLAHATESGEPAHQLHAPLLDETI